MGTIAEKLSYLEQTKAEIAEAIISNGGSITDETPFRSYAYYIRAIVEAAREEGSTPIPIACLYGTSDENGSIALAGTEGYALYKGLVASPLPTTLEHNTGNIDFPYIYVVRNTVNSTDKLYFFQYPLEKMTQYGSDGVRPNYDLYPNYYTYEFTVSDSGEWLDPGGGSSGNPHYFGTTYGNSLHFNFAVNEILWANTDILDENGNIYFAASEPIPLYKGIVGYTDDNIPIYE